MSNRFEFPKTVATNLVSPAGFAKLHAEALAGRLKIVWPTVQFTNETVAAMVSIEDFGHWLSRDWHRFPMTRRGDSWEARVPVESLDTPVVYYLRAAGLTATNFSPMRYCLPRDAGLEQPNRFFWSFLEGFEEGTESWQLLSAGSETLRTDSLAQNGRAALLVSIPAGKRSASIGTTLVRGSQILENGGVGLRVAMRTRAGEGRARFTLYANAYSTNQMPAAFSAEPVVSNRWQRIDLPFARFSKLPLGEIDFFTIDLIGDGPCEFLLDDLELLTGRVRE